MRKRNQTLVFVIFLMSIVAILAGTIAAMWHSEIKVSSTHDHGLTAFYLAQAAVEQGKIEVMYDVNNLNSAFTNSGCTCSPLGAGCFCLPDPGVNEWDDTTLDDATDNFTFRYNLVADSLSGTIVIVGRGEVLDNTNNVLAHKEIQITVTGIADGDLDGIDDDGVASFTIGTWQEI